MDILIRGCTSQLHYCFNTEIRLITDMRGIDTETLLDIFGCVVSSPDHTPSPIAREGLVTLVDFLGPGSNIFPGMSGKESDWSEGQLLRNTNHIDRMMGLTGLSLT